METTQKTAPLSFAGKKITLMGLGLLGRGVGDALFFLDQGAEIIVTDKKTENELAPSLEKLYAHPAAQKLLTVRVGGHTAADFENRDYIIFAAGIRPDNTYLVHARSHGVPVTMSTALFARIARERGATIVGVTGTRGKSTITHMIHYGLSISNTFAHKEIFLGGNVRGVSTLALLPDIDEASIIVLELDSWQLHGFGIEKVSPHISVFSNFYPDHLNYYSSMEEYFSDKANIYAFQDSKQGDALFVGDAVPRHYLETHVPSVPPIFVTPIPSEWQLRVPGEHNRYNASLAREALAQMGVPETEIAIAVQTFKGVPGRLEYMGELTRTHVPVYNDNNATTPEATIAALDTLAARHGNTIILIAGGTDKGLDLTRVAERINGVCKKVLLLDENGSRMLRPLLSVPVQMHTTFQKSVTTALESVQEGDVVLFSPLFSSFGNEFKNEYDRDDKFRQIVKRYLTSTSASIIR